MLRTSALIAFGLFVLACGNSKPPESTTSTKDAGAETFAEVNPADVAELNATKDAGITTPPPPAASSVAAAPAAPPDDCTPVGVDFEKRARPKLKECYATGKKKDPNLQGTVRVAVEIDTTGKWKSTKITEKTLPDPVADCMLKVVKATPLPDAAKCPAKTLTIPMTFPTPP